MTGASSLLVLSGHLIGYHGKVRTDYHSGDLAHSFRLSRKLETQKRIEWSGTPTITMPLHTGSLTGFVRDNPEVATELFALLHQLHLKETKKHTDALKKVICNGGFDEEP